MKAIWIILYGLLITGCAITPESSVFHPPHDFTVGSKENSTITFIDAIPESRNNYSIITFAEARNCSGQHALRPQVTNTINVPNGKKFSFVVMYTIMGYKSANICSTTLTFTPSGGNYQVISKLNQETCSTLIMQKTPNHNLEPVEAEVRVRKQAFFASGPWCE